MNRNLSCALLAVAIALPSTVASTQETWTVLPLAARGVHPDDAATFRDLLQLELGSGRDLFFVQGALPCQDDACARGSGEALGADVAVYGMLSALGSEVIASATVVDVRSGRVRSVQRMTVDRVEELDTVAERMAAAIHSGTSTAETAQLGMITSEEAEAEIRREGDSGFGMRVGGIAPFADGYADAGFGVLIDLAYWFETLHFAIEPRVGFRFSTGREDASYFELPIDVGGYYILGRGDVAGIAGGGAGIRFISESRPATFVTGTVVRTSLETVLDDSQWGLGTFGRLGLLLLRTYTVRMAITVDYNITFVELNGFENPQSLTFGLGVIL